MKTHITIIENSVKRKDDSYQYSSRSCWKDGWARLINDRKDLLKKTLHHKSLLSLNPRFILYNNKKKIIKIEIEKVW